MTTLRFSSEIPWWILLLIAIVGSLCIARWVWNESKHLTSSLRWVLPACRGTAFFFILLMLAGPTLYHQRIDGVLSRIRVLLDNSMSMSTADVQPVGATRLDRAWSWLLGEPKDNASPGWLQALRRHHRVDLVLTNPPSTGGTVWDSQLDPHLPDAGTIPTAGASSRLGERLSDSLAVQAEPNATDADKKATNAADRTFAAVVLISDGQSNEGLPMSEAASRYAEEKIPVFAIGVGNANEPEDLGIVQVEHSQRVYRPDRLRGTVVLKERMKAGTPYRLEVHHSSKTVFVKSMESMDQGLRRIEFDIPAEILLDQTKQTTLAGVTYWALPIDLDFSVVCKAPEISLANNHYQSSLWGVERKNRILILDRRGGWETRYIKNAFERDAAWDATVALGRSAFESDPFPKSRATLFDFDLILSSLETLRNLSTEQQAWLSDFVSLSGGGLIVIDSPQQRASQTLESNITAILPVRIASQEAFKGGESLQITPRAKNQPALQLGVQEFPNDEIWSRLPVPKSVRSVELAPGSESMVDIQSSIANKLTQPLVVTKLFGQGRVLYMAAEETWRWRYEVADRYHQRFWSQVATWTMRTPFAISNSFVSLDSGGRVYTPTDTIAFRARLKNEDSRPLTDASANIVLERNDERFLSLPLDQEEDARGFYRATGGPLPVGRYRVRLEVAGIPNDALNVETQFVVQPPVDVEMQTLACNPGSLRQLASITGGEFLMIEDAASISDKLKRFRTGSLVESQVLLWQSYPWFATIVGLLSLEWFLRKRAGLV